MGLFQYLTSCWNGLIDGWFELPEELGLHRSIRFLLVSGGLVQFVTLETLDSNWWFLVSCEWLSPLKVEDSEICPGCFVVAGIPQVMFEALNPIWRFGLRNLIEFGRFDVSLLWFCDEFYVSWLIWLLSMRILSDGCLRFFEFCFHTALGFLAIQK